MLRLLEEKDRGRGERWVSERTDRHCNLIGDHLRLIMDSGTAIGAKVILHPATSFRVAPELLADALNSFDLLATEI
jgi:hypothetical protein